MFAGDDAESPFMKDALKALRRGVTSQLQVSEVRGLFPHFYFPQCFLAAGAGLLRPSKPPTPQPSTHLTPQPSNPLTPHPSTLHTPHRTTLNSLPKTSNPFHPAPVGSSPVSSPVR